MEILSDTVFRGGMQAKSVTVGNVNITSDSVVVPSLYANTLLLCGGSKSISDFTDITKYVDVGSGSCGSSDNSEYLAIRCGYFVFDGSFLNRIGKCSKFYVVPGNSTVGSVPIESCYADSNTPMVCAIEFDSGVIDISPNNMFIGQIFYDNSDKRPVSGVSIHPIIQHCSETHATIFLVEQYVSGTELYCKSDSKYEYGYLVKFLNYEMPAPAF